MRAPPSRQIPLQQISAPAAQCMPSRRRRHTHSQPGLSSAAAAAAQGLTYEAAGVNIDAGSELVRRIQKLNPSIGGFSGMVPFGAGTEVASGPEHFYPAITFCYDCVLHADMAHTRTVSIATVSFPARCAPGIVGCHM